MTYFKFLSIALLLTCLTSELLAYPFSYQLGGTNFTGTCVTGRQQSPIDIDTSAVESDNNLSLTLDFYNLGSDSKIVYKRNFGFIPHLTHTPDMFNHDTYQVIGPYGMAFADNANYQYLASDFKQMHLHSPSVNTVNGKLYDVEIHFMFLVDPAQTKGLNLTRRVTQFAVFFSINDTAPENPLIAALDLNNIGAPLDINFTKLVISQIGENPEFYYYEGSLDAPPCDEIINYYIVKESLPITTNQVKAVANLMNGKAGGNGEKPQSNNRPTQPLNGRVVKLGNVGSNNSSNTSSSGSGSGSSYNSSNSNSSSSSISITTTTTTSSDGKSGYNSNGSSSTSEGNC